MSPRKASPSPNHVAVPAPLSVRRVVVNPSSASSPARALTTARPTPRRAVVPVKGPAPRSPKPLRRPNRTRPAVP